MTKISNILPQQAYSVKQVRENEVKAAAELAIPIYELMLRAGNAAFALLNERYKGVKSILVICGKGNNGGDGFVVARLAKQADINVTVLLLTEQNTITGDAKSAMEEYCQQGGEIYEVNNIKDVEKYYFQCDVDLIVDAILGTGFNGILRAFYADVIEFVNQQSCSVLSLDIPSGLNADTGAISPIAINADSCITFIALKQGLLTGQAANYCGRLYFANLDVEVIFTQITQSHIFLLNADSKPALPQRKPTSHKGDIGLVLTVGGGEGMPGAIRLSSEAALRAGAALVAVCCLPQNQAMVFNGRPELMLAPDNITSLEISPIIAKAKTIVVGPGLGRNNWAKELYDYVNTLTEKTLVVDADGLYFLAEQPNINPQRIITPHPKEASLLLNCTVADIEADRFAAVRQLANKYGGVCVLKGAGSLVSDGEQVWINTTGNAGMASGGMGDVLSGIIAALSLQLPDLLAAVKLGVYLHGHAADIVAQQQGQCGMLASDLLLPLQASVNGNI